MPGKRPEILIASGVSVLVTVAWILVVPVVLLRVSVGDTLVHLAMAADPTGIRGDRGLGAPRRNLLLGLVVARSGAILVGRPRIRPPGPIQPLPIDVDQCRPDDTHGPDPVTAEARHPPA